MSSKTKLAESQTILPDKSNGSGFNLRPWCWIVERTVAWLKWQRIMSVQQSIPGDLSCWP